MAPAQTLTVSETIQLIAESEELFGSRMVVAEIEIRFQPILPGDVEDDAQAHTVVVGWHGGDELIVLHGARKVRRGDERQQAKRGGVQLACRNSVARKRSMGSRIENTYRTLRERLRKIARSLQRCGHGSQPGEPIPRAIAEIIEKELNFVVVNQLGDI